MLLFFFSHVVWGFWRSKRDVGDMANGKQPYVILIVLVIAMIKPKGKANGYSRMVVSETLRFNLNIQD